MKKQERVQKRIDEVWWIAVDHTDCPIWPYLEVRRCDVVESLKRDWGDDWRTEGWRVAKLHVREETQKFNARLRAG
jgi:hypothetical protein